MWYVYKYNKKETLTFFLNVNTTQKPITYQRQENKIFLILFFFPFMIPNVAQLVIMPFNAFKITQQPPTPRLIIIIQRQWQRRPLPPSMPSIYSVRPTNTEHHCTGAIDVAEPTKRSTHVDGMNESNADFRLCIRAVCAIIVPSTSTVLSSISIVCTKRSWQWTSIWRAICERSLGRWRLWCVYFKSYSTIKQYKN